MKASVMYSGVDSTGRPINLAQGANGAWFWREYAWNGFGYAWSKWAKYEQEVIYPEKVKNNAEYSGAAEYIDIPEGDRRNQIEWGFKLLNIVPGPHRVRLPE